MPTALVSSSLFTADYTKKTWQNFWAFCDGWKPWLRFGKSESQGVSDISNSGAGLRATAPMRFEARL
jgi:hypothetical protein